MVESLEDLGKQLAEARQAKQLTIEQLSHTTKISPSYIEMMEKGHFHFLPDVYVRAFLRTIAQQIGLDAEVMTNQLEKIKTIAIETVKESEKQEKKLEVTTPFPHSLIEAESESSADLNDKREMPIQNPYGLMNIYLLGSLAIVLTLLLFLWPSEQKATLENKIQSGIDIIKNKQTTSPDTKDFLPIADSNLPDTLGHELITLNLRATETVWLRIVYDDSLEEEGLFSPGDTRTFTGHGKIYLKIGNAGGIHMKVNGKEVGVAGKKGSVVNLLINDEGVASISDEDFPKSKQENWP